MSSPWASSQAMATCAGVASSSRATASTSSTMRRLLLEVLAHEPGVGLAPVAVVEVVHRADGAGEQAVAERRVRHEPDAELAAHVEDTVFGVTGPQRILRLQRRDRVHGVGSPDRGRSRLGQPEVTNLALRRRARPWRRRSPRSGCRGRRGAGSRGRCSRCRDAAAILRRRGGRSPALLSSPLRPVLDMNPNLVASTTWSRRPLRARPTSSSLVCGP